MKSRQRLAHCAWQVYHAQVTNIVCKPLTFMKKKLAIAALLACFATLPVHAQTNEQSLAQADTLIREGKAAEAFALLEPLEAKLAGDATYDYLLATAALQAGNPSRATFIYERILAINPEFIGVRADMGRAYYQMGDLARAKLEFESILALSNLPSDLRTAVESYLSALSQIDSGAKRVVVGYFDAGFGRNTNVLSQTSAEIIRYGNGTSYTLTPVDRKRADKYLSYGMGAELIQNIDGGLSFYAGGDFRGRTHSRIDAADNFSLDTRAGLQYASGGHVVRGGVTLGSYNLDNINTRDSAGLTLDWRYALNQTNQVSLGGTATSYRYVPNTSKSENYDSYVLNLGWTHVFAPTTVGVLTLTNGTENATNGRGDGDKRYWGLRAIFQHSLTSQLGTFFTAGNQWGDYSRYNTTYGLDRNDRLFDAAAGMAWSLPDRWTVRPMVSYVRNRSNADIYTYSGRDFSVVVRKDF